ncbi:MAG: acetyl/propionyl-CoA carboxylase subuit alpha [Microbacterium sp. SCN 70-200]|uniref:acetyl/propionyl/methylcrotonyl-CoA carboxylase subunit alpha n=1 Tax=unclassified Microbacterium TaxID=2609290 RepID=UPI00086D6288|nr:MULTISPECIES: biotin carboxylase N-terminal domain-containing protein [unclassified Microbacterium]MBN9215490.1 ATP-grasp domain-containing protein [Microbacterium sp.]ODT42039.1 MAG: acetyl/propionyl-CoA carboxylase subuit alpha [Microbacterium sp. SCN 70-200]OJV79524.1 MAG: acetyl/propionyl-CoA carboxylase subuit alpha [Microbacterium sp. 70-16]
MTASRPFDTNLFDTALFDTVLIANRGEIAVRIIHTLRRLGIRSIAVYSEADAGALHVREADEAVRLGPAAAAESYLSIDRVIDAARRTGAQAIHPGFGFLAENAAFARACAAAGIVFIGPTPESIEAMGDKISARAAVEARGVATVPGLARADLTDADLIAGASAVGFPVLIKPSAGGGGKGMHVVTDATELPAALAAARREAAASFGDDTLFLERYVASPRHIEVQIVADAHGNVIHLGERECSLQRRHQKVIEEAPSPLLEGLENGAVLRAQLGAAACETARSVDYVGAGTVEFIVSADAPDEFFFMEMNTRLQVEHPVTEQVTGLDLVELQVRIAAGETLPVSQDDIVLTGHSIEARVYGEDPQAGFLPTGGRVLRVVHPGPAVGSGVAVARPGLPVGSGVRVDTALADGLDVSTDYDPMLAKIIATGTDRAEALRRLTTALSSTAVLGFETNLEFLRLLLQTPEVVAGDLDTGLIARVFDALPFAEPDARRFAEAALVWDAVGSGAPRGGGATGVGGTGGAAGPWLRGDGWRLGPAAARRWRLEAGGRERVVAVRGAAHPSGSAASGHPTPPNGTDEARVQVDDGPEWRASVTIAGDGHTLVTIAGVTRPVVWAADPDGPGGGGPGPDGSGGLWLAAGGATFRFTERVAGRASAADAEGSPQVVSPLPGTVVLVPASDGGAVAVGDPLVVVEAMKMEHVLRAAVAGTVRIAVSPGDRVTRGAVVATVEPLPTAAPPQ